MTPYYCLIEALFDVPLEVFTPKLEVDSAIVDFLPYERSEEFENQGLKPTGHINLGNFVKFTQFVEERELSRSLKKFLTSTDFRY
ncbi:MAG: hypothetical protein AAGB12_15140 [Pseudomonadota bacterium]